MSSYPPDLNVNDRTERVLWRDLDLPAEDRWWFIRAHRDRTRPDVDGHHTGGGEVR